MPGKEPGHHTPGTPAPKTGMLPVIGWAIWYSNRPPRRGKSPEAMQWAPKTGVQCVVYYHLEDRRTVVMGESYYSVPRSLWKGRAAPWRGKGEWMEDGDFNALIERAMVE